MSFYLFINTFDIARLSPEMRAVLHRDHIEIKPVNPKDLPSGTATLIVKKHFDAYIKAEVDAYRLRHAEDRDR